VHHGERHRKEADTLTNVPIHVEVGTASGAEAALTILCDARDRGHAYDVLVTDWIMEPFDGLWLIDQLRPNGFDPDSLDVILLSRKDDIERKRDELEEVKKRWQGDSTTSIKEVLRVDLLSQIPEEKLGQEERHEAAFLEAVWRRVERKLEESASRALVRAYPFHILGEQEPHTGFTHNPILAEKIQKLLKGAATSDEPILITGEHGTGKNDLAKLIHESSPRCTYEMVEINIAALPSSLIEAELFGYEKGAFTGALKKNLGLIEHAKGSTLFIDEIGDLSLELQAKLLHVLENRPFRRVGGRAPIQIDFRFIAATNHDLEDDVKNRLFRDDLYYRLNVVRFHLPPLRERREDIPFLINFFWRTQTDSLPARSEEWLPEAYVYWQILDWPGNVRQIRNHIKRLKLDHPAGKPVTEEALKQQDVADYPPGLDAHKTYTSRRYHVLFYQALRSAINMANSPQDITDKMIDRVIETDKPYFEKPSDKSIEGVRDNISQIWQTHKRACDICTLLWENYT
jgi:DNA-binding NtrC family response regulator